MEIKVASAVLISQNTRLLVVTRLFVTTNELAHAAKLTVPAGLFIVCAQTVKAGVIVLSAVTVIKVLFVRLSVVALPTKVSVALGKVIVRSSV